MNIVGVISLCAGGILVYSGIRNVSPRQVVVDAMQGKVTMPAVGEGDWGSGPLKPLPGDGGGSWGPGVPDQGAQPSLNGNGAAGTPRTVQT